MQRLNFLFHFVHPIFQFFNFFIGNHEWQSCFSISQKQFINRGRSFGTNRKQIKLNFLKLSNDIFILNVRFCNANISIQFIDVSIRFYSCAGFGDSASAVKSGFTYPALMAADILLYQPDYVPVGSDQKQHVELCRDVATRFNNIYGDVFKIPEPYIPKIGARVMSLVSPENKMSKSDKDPNGTVYLLDRPEDIMRKFKKAVTDSDTERCVRYDLANKPGVSNLMSIYSACTGKTFEEIEAEFDGKGYGAFKPAVGEAVVETLRPIREESERLLKDKAYLESVYKAGAEKASYIANKTLRKVYKKVGFVAK